MLHGTSTYEASTYSMIIAWTVFFCELKTIFFWSNIHKECVQHCESTACFICYFQLRFLICVIYYVFFSLCWKDKFYSKRKKVMKKRNENQKSVRARVHFQKQAQCTHVPRKKIYICNQQFCTQTIIIIFIQYGFGYIEKKIVRSWETSTSERREEIKRTHAVKHKTMFINIIINNNRISEEMRFCSIFFRYIYRFRLINF